MAEPARKAPRTESSTAASSSAVRKQKEVTGPFSVLETAKLNGEKVIVKCRFDRMLTGLVKAYDKHFNMLLTDVTEIIQTNDGEAQQRSLGSVVLRGDSVVFVVKMG